MRRLQNVLEGNRSIHKCSGRNKKDIECSRRNDVVRSQGKKSEENG
jgi:hypothetical protein